MKKNNPQFKALSALILSGIILLPLLHTSNDMDPFQGPKLAAFFALAAVMGICLVFFKLPNKFNLNIPRHIFFTLISLGAVYFLSSLINFNLIIVQNLAEWMGFVLITFAALVCFRCDPKSFLHWLFLATKISLFMLVVACIYFYSQTSVTFAYFGNTNAFAEYLGILLMIVAFELLFERYSPISLMIFFGGFLVFAIQNCRSAFIALGVGVGFLLLNSKKSKTNLFLVAVVSVVICTMAPTVFPSAPEIKDNFLLGKSFNTTVSRLKVWKNSVSMIIEHPMGIGPSLFEFIYPSYGGITADGIFRSPHNGFLELAVEEGVAALILFSFLVFSLYKKSKTLAHRDLIISLLIYYFIQAFFAFPLENQCPFYFLAIIFGLILYELNFLKGFDQVKVNLKYVCYLSLPLVLYFAEMNLRSVYNLETGSDFFESYQTGCRANPFAWLYCFDEGLIEKNHNPGEALATFTKMLTLNPKNPWVKIEIDKLTAKGKAP